MDARNKKYCKRLTLIIIFVIILLFICDRAKKIDLIEEVKYYEQFNVDAVSNDTFNYKAALSINSDVVGAIRMDDVSKFYPIMNNSEYRYTNIYGDPSSFGTAYVSGSYAFNEENVIIYANAENNGFMFSFLSGLRSSDVAGVYDKVTIYNKENEIHYRIFSSFTCPVDDPIIESSFETQEERRYWLYDVINKSNYNYNFCPDVTEQTIMLVGLPKSSEYVYVAVLTKDDRERVTQ